MVSLLVGVKELSGIARLYNMLGQSAFPHPACNLVHLLQPRHQVGRDEAAGNRSRCIYSGGWRLEVEQILSSRHEFNTTPKR